MNNTLTATATTTIHASPSKVWEALTDPVMLKQYYFGADIITDWLVGSPIIYRGVYEGKAYEDKGNVLQVEPEKSLLVTHWSPLSGTADTPENYHTVHYELMDMNGSTRVTITQDNCASKEEQEQNASFWASVLDGMKKVVEV